MIFSAHIFNANQLNVNVLEVFEKKQLLQTPHLASIKFCQQ